MNEKEILANAPEGWTHYSDEGEDVFWKVTDEKVCLFVDKWIRCWDSPLHSSIRSRADIERIVELEAELKSLQGKS